MSENTTLKTLTIDISASHPQTGKTTAAVIIARALLEAGFLKVSVNASEERSLASASAETDDRVKSLAGKDIQVFINDLNQPATREVREKPAFIFNPYTGDKRDPRDIASDPRGLAIAASASELKGLHAAPIEAKTPAPELSERDIAGILATTSLVFNPIVDTAIVAVTDPENPLFSASIALLGDGPFSGKWMMFPGRSASSGFQDKVNKLSRAIVPGTLQNVKEEFILAYHSLRAQHAFVKPN